MHNNNKILVVKMISLKCSLHNRHFDIGNMHNEYNETGQILMN